MTFTIHFGSWMLPAGLTLAAIIVTLIVAYKDSQSGGWGAGLMTGITFIASALSCAAAWLVWGVTFCLK